MLIAQMSDLHIAEDGETMRTFVDATGDLTDHGRAAQTFMTEHAGDYQRRAPHRPRPRPAVPDRLSLLGSPRERAETRARLEVVAITPERDPVSRTLERDTGIGLGW